MSDERREQKRQAQARYRKAHAERLAHARQITNIVLRQRDYFDDIERLAAGLRKLLTAEGVKALRAELGRRRPPPSRRRRGSR
jgi:hypothetical protein